MFDKILVANRGEIACRIIKTAKILGIETVAIYSSADSQSLHVEQADEAYWVGEALAKDSYLNIDAILTIAKKAKVEAIHPGYGFLSENPLFAEACARAGIIFIGPSIQSLKVMGSKQLAKALLEGSKVPLIPGFHGKDQSDEELFAAAETLGFPLLIKAASGGGGKGMKTVHSAADFIPMLASARREAMASFADDTMILEKCLQAARHIEVQIMADNFGHVLHFFERDCSLQRRHQKIIEEAPALNLSAKLREALTQAAIEVAKAIEYRGAGTVEFLVTPNEHFYFIEMNTRLQVEHPVTEMITGMDLVALQFKVAANEPLTLSQTEIKVQGHAIECRLYAEDPEQNFLPSTGVLSFFQLPKGLSVRVDTGVGQSSEISQYYDPMIAKLIVHANSRELALQRLVRALNDFAIGGIKTNQPFLQAISANPRFIKGAISTDFLLEEEIHFLQPDKHLVFLLALAYDYLALVRENKEPLFGDCFCWNLHASGRILFSYSFAGEKHEFIVFPIAQDEFSLEFQGKWVFIKAKLENQKLSIIQEEEKHQAWVQSCEQGLTLYLAQGSLRLERFSELSTQENSSHEARDLKAPMPAIVVAILKEAGESIKKGEELMVLEAMKMEHAILAPKDGLIAEFFYQVGQQVEEGAELLILKDFTTS